MGGRAGHLEAEVAVSSSARAASWASQAGRASLLCAVFLSLWVSPLFFFPSLTRGFGRRNNDACRAGSSQVSEVDLFGGGRSVGQTRQPTARSASVLPGLDFNASDASRGHGSECYRVPPAQCTCRLTRALRRFSPGPGARALSPESEP